MELHSTVDYHINRCETSTGALHCNTFLLSLLSFLDCEAILLKLFVSRHLTLAALLSSVVIVLVVINFLLEVSLERLLLFLLSLFVRGFFCLLYWDPVKLLRIDAVNQLLV